MKSGGTVSLLEGIGAGLGRALGDRAGDCCLGAAYSEVLT